MDYLDESRVIRRYIMPLGEIVIDFYDKLKSLTKGYASMNYEFFRYEESSLVRLDILINSERMEAFSQIVHQDKSYATGKSLVEKLKELIPKHMFSIPLQAGVGSKIIARETISAMKKDVLAKCYG
jgi:GTP-binding protein LepA